MNQWVYLRLVIVVIVLALLQVVIPIMVNYNTESVPELFIKYPWLPARILGGLIVLYLVVSLLHTFYSREPKQDKPAHKPTKNEPTDEATQKAQPDESESDDALDGYIVGPVIKDPANFVGRQAQVERFFTNLNDSHHHSLQVLGLRRAGKTSFLRYVSHPEVLRKKARDADRVLVVYINLQRRIRKVADFYLKLAKGINHCLPKKARIPIPRRGIPSTDAFEEWLESPVLADYRLIILLDEFEVLRKEAAFDVNFFQELRSLADHDSVPLVWVTSSYIDLFRLTRLKGDKEKTSPFFNIFDPDPIILARLTLSEADELIQKPAACHGVDFSSSELFTIQQLAGRLPFFLQAAARAWFQAKQQGQDDLYQIKGEVKQKFAANMAQYFDSYWQKFNEQEQTLLTGIATQSATDWSAYRLPNRDLFVTHLVRYGIITSQEEDYPYRIAGEVFAEWIRNRAEMPPAPDSESED